MKVLWVVNTVLPEVAHLAGFRASPFGGWVGTMLDQVRQYDHLELGVVMKAPVAEMMYEKKENVEFYILPEKGRFDVHSEDCQRVLERFQPDLLHVEGTESAHSRRFLSLWSRTNIVSLQGIINGYEPYLFGGLSTVVLLSSLHPVKMVVAATMILNKLLLFKPRLAGEVRSIELAQNLLGRTSWDRAHSYAINPRAPYYTCNRILRKPFYRTRWDGDTMEKHTVFIGSSMKPLKGAHFVLHAVKLLKRDFPDIRLIIAGDTPWSSSWRQWKKKIGYPALLRYLIQDLQLEDNVECTGLLDAEIFADRLCKANVFVLSSIIENSPNTLGEAMIMGVPTVAAYSGGVSDMAVDGTEVLLYRDDDPNVLALQIRRIFESRELARTLSENSRKHALITHDPVKNGEKLIKVYQEVLGV